ncbi:hypothetical protein AHAS_Ahas07G0098700 [Arachis hypogaea]
MLVPDDHCDGTRESLQILIPGRMVVDDILNLVASMCTNTRFEDLEMKWWLPTTFAQIALSPTSHCAETLDFIKRKYMGFADKLMKIYVPLFRDGHWYLVIVDLCNGELVYLDSAKSDVPVERKARLDQIKYVAFFIENMLNESVFYKDIEQGQTSYPRCSSYILVEPEIGQKAPNS